MKDAIKEIIKDTPFDEILKLRRKFLKRRVTEGTTKLNILKTFPQYEAHGWGLYDIRAKLTIQSINQLIPALSDLCPVEPKNRLFEESIKEMIDSDSSDKERLADLFSKFGSDKATTHDYYKLYSAILSSIENVSKIFEIGLGTNNTDIVSTMGKNGKPGASLRAFREYINGVEVYGADFDERILFNEDRIKTFFVDQTSPKTFVDLGKNIGIDFDLMIDDGLHAPNANLHSLNFFLPRIKIGGYAIIEDVNIRTKDIWNIVSTILPNNYESAFIETKAACVFVVKRIS